MKKEDMELFQEFLAFKEFKKTQEESLSKSENKPARKKTTKYRKRKDGRYYTNVTIGKNEETGKPIQISVYGKTLAEIEDKITQLKIEKQRGTNFSKRNITFGTYRKIWFEKKKLKLNGNNSIHTIKMYESVFRNYFKEIDDIKLIEITSNDLQSIIDDAINKPRTCQKIRMCLNEIFKFAISERILYYNPVDSIVIPPYSSPDKRALTDDENYLTDICEITDREKALIMILKYTGVRKEEALALEKKDFNFKNKEITINKALIFDNNTPILKDTKNVTSRVIPILPNIEHFMEYYIKNLQTNNLFVNIGNREYMTQQGYKRMWEAIMRKLKSKAKELNMRVGDDLTAHVFRHNFACMLMYAGVDMKERQYLLGHKTISVTMDIYTHIESNKMNAPSKLGEYILKLHTL